MIWRTLLSVVSIGMWHWVSAALSIVTNPVANEMAASQFQGGAEWQKNLATQNILQFAQSFSLFYVGGAFARYLVCANTQDS